MSTWGTTALVAELPDRPNGTIYRILAAIDGTTVLQDGSVIATLNKGEFHETDELAGNHEFEAVQPILVTAFMTGRKAQRATTGDPAMGNVVPSDQFSNHYTFSTVGGGQFDVHYLQVFADNADTSTITLDGSPIGAGNFTAIGSSGYSVANISLSEGSHTTASDLGHGIFVIGLADSDSYLYSGGAQFDDTLSDEISNELFNEDIAQLAPEHYCGQLTGSSIDTAIGAQCLEQTLLTVQGLLPISFTLEYNSRLLKTGVTGRGWGESYFGARLEELDNDDVNIHWTTNRYNHFKKQANQYECSHPACRFDKLSKNANGSFTLSRQNKRVYQFSNIGKLIQMGNHKNQFLTLSYEGEGRLARVTEPVSGVFLDYAYNEDLLETVTGPLGRQIRLEYDNDQNLTRMRPDKPQLTRTTSWGKRSRRSMPTVCNCLAILIVLAAPPG